MPAPTPKMTRAGAGTAASGSAGAAFNALAVEQPLLDLTERDGQRLLLAAGLDQRADILQQPLAELGVIRVDLPCAFCGHDPQPVLAVHDLEKLVDRRVDDAVGDLSPCHVLPSVVYYYNKGISWRHTSWTDVLTSVTSNSAAAASSSCAAASRRASTSGGSVPRPVSLRTSSSHDGGARNTSLASGAARLPCRAPATSISSRQATPASSFSFRGARGVPYWWSANRAHSSSAPPATSRSNSLSSTK